VSKDIELPEVWMIAITGNPISEYYKVRMIPHWEREGFKVNTFEAVVPETLHLQKDLVFGSKFSFKTEKYRKFTRTELAIWYSHYNTWKMCWELQKPIIVTEHDVRPCTEFQYKKFPHGAVYKHNICCLAHDHRGFKKNGERIWAKLAGGAYYITPNGARELLKARHIRPKIQYNSDAWIHRTCDKFGHWAPEICTQFKNPKVGYTIEHKS